MSIKTYVLLEHLRPTASYYVQINKEQKSRIDTIPVWQPYLQVTFLDQSEQVLDYDPESKTFGEKIPNKKKGQNRTIRLKLNSNTPYQDEQIEKEKIPANEKFELDEYAAATFRHNTLTTSNPAVQRYLEVYPAFEGFKGVCANVKQACYKLYDPTVEIESENKDFLNRLAAANKIAAMDLKQAQDTLIRIYGVAHKVPDTVKAAQNALVSYMDSSDEALDEILKEEITIDEEVQILVGRLVSSGKLSFDAVPGQVAKKKGNDWIELKAIGNDYTPIERQRYFMEFLTSEAGKLLLTDLKKEGELKEVKKDKKVELV